MRFDPQVLAHLPLEQTSDALHFDPHVPQFAGSLASTVHDAPHACEPGPQFKPASGATTGVMSVGVVLVHACIRPITIAMAAAAFFECFMETSSVPSPHTVG